MAHYTDGRGSRQVVVGLGNGTMLRFKRKGLVMEEICEGCHKSQVDAVVVGGGVMVTAGGDK